MDQIFNMISDRFKNAFVLNFVLVWLFVHKYEVLVLLWGEGQFQQRLLTFKNSLSDVGYMDLYLTPALLSVFLVVFLPFLKLPSAWISGVYESWTDRFHSSGKSLPLLFAEWNTIQKDQRTHSAYKYITKKGSDGLSNKWVNSYLTHLAKDQEFRFTDENLAYIKRIVQRSGKTVCENR